MYRVVFLFAFVLGFVSLNGVCEEPDLHEGAMFVAEKGMEAVIIQSDTTLVIIGKGRQVPGAYTLKDGKTLEVTFTILGEKTVRTLTVGEKGLTTADGTLLYSETGREDLEKSKRERFIGSLRRPTVSSKIREEREAADRAITDRIIAKENSYLKVSMNVLGAYLGDHYKDKKLVVIMPGIRGDESRDGMQLDALKAGIDGRLTVVVEKIQITPGSVVFGPEGMPTCAQFDEVMAKYKDAGVFLSMAGLPIDFMQMDFWEMEDRVRPALALANSNVFELRKAIQKGVVSVVLHNSPEAIYDPRAEFPADPAEAFKQRYILIDKDNVDAVAKKWPEMFKEEPKNR